MKNILITGISKGLGLELCRSLLRDEGVVIYGVSRTMTSELEHLRKQYKERLHWQPFDLANTEAIEIELFGRFITPNIILHGFIDNAAILYKDLVVRMDPFAVSWLMKINVEAPMVLTKCVLRNFMHHKTKGSIVHFSSICAHDGFNGLAMMGASKGALESFSRSVACEYGRCGIRSNVVVIGLLEMGMGFSVNGQQSADLKSRSPLGINTEYKSIEQTVRLLLSESGGSITGQNIHINSGIL